jgi:hypothetical protein
VNDADPQNAGHIRMLLGSGMTSNLTSRDEEFCAVVRVGDVWRLVHSGRQWGRFDYQVDAVEAALRLARKAATRGRRIEVLIQDRWGEVSPLAVA